MSKKTSSESVVREIYRKTSKKYSSEEKSVLSSKGHVANPALQNCAAVKESIQIFTLPMEPGVPGRRQTTAGQRHQTPGD